MYLYKRAARNSGNLTETGNITTSPGRYSGLILYPQMNGSGNLPPVNNENDTLKLKQPPQQPDTVFRLLYG